MNAVLFYMVPQFRLTGSLINAIEYFLAGYEHNNKLKLILIDGNRSAINKIQYLIQERYDLADYRHSTNIVCMRKSMLPRTTLDTILVVDYVTIAETKGLLNAKKILVISELYTDVQKYFYNKSLYNVEYFGEMPFHYKDHDYTMKCLFNSYKPLKDVQAGTYVNSPKNPDLIYEVEKIREKYIHLPTPFIFKSKSKPEENLFEKFTHYLYYHADKYFDPHPRLFLECTFYNKCITYYNPHIIKDGSWHRYKHIQAYKLHNRTLDGNDEIIRRLA